MMGRVSAERERELARATSVCGDSSRKLWGDGSRRRMEIHLHFGGATDTEQPHDPQNLQESKNTTTKKKGNEKGWGQKCRPTLKQQSTSCCPSLISCTFLLCWQQQRRRRTRREWERGTESRRIPDRPVFLFK